MEPTELETNLPKCDLLHADYPEIFSKYLSRFFGCDEMHHLRPLHGRRIMDIAKEGSGDVSLVIGSCVLMIDALLIAFFDS